MKLPSGFPTAAVAETMAEFKRRLVAVDCHPDLQERMTYILRGEGKYIRPLLLLTFYRLMGQRGEAGIQAALAVEYIHAASLIHDDIIDEASLRRGRTTAHKKWSIKEALLAGDFLYARAFELLGSLRCEQATSILARAVGRLSAGELLQLVTTDSAAMLFNSDAYYKMIYDKTAVIFGACCELAALLSAKTVLRDQARQFGDAFGMAFQLRDDMRDYLVDQMQRDEILQDLHQGRITLPLIRAYQLADAQQQHFMRATLHRVVKNGTEHKTSLDKDLMRIAGLARKPEVIAYLKERMRSYLMNAEAALKHFPASEERSSLFHVTGLLLNSIASPSPLLSEFAQ